MRKKMMLNPILKKELAVSARTMRMSWMIMGVNLFLTLVVLCVISVTNWAGWSSGYGYGTLSWLFPILGCAECAVLSLIVPMVTATSITGERERQTLDIILTTPMSPFAIAAGKLYAAMAVTMLYMVTSIPILAVSFVLGGVNWWALPALLGLMLFLGIYVGSVGIFCSSVAKKSVTATIMTIAIGIGILVGTALILYGIIVVQSNVKYTDGMSYEGPGVYTLIMLLNPYSAVFDFMLRTMSTSGMDVILEDVGTKSEVALAVGRHWTFFCIVLNLFISWMFLKLAARNLTVERKRGRNSGQKTGK